MARSRHPCRIFTKPPDPQVWDRYARTYESREVIDHPDHFPLLTPGGMFGAAGTPLWIDVGCSTGEFIVELARRNQSGLHVGIDQAEKPLYRAVNAAHAGQLRNVKFIKGDFRLLPSLMRPGSIEVLCYHFPHPFVRTRQRLTGIFSMAILDSLRPALTPGGIISVLTDSEPMWEHMLWCAAAAPGYSHTTEGPFHLAIDDGLKSFHHLKWEGQGRVIRRMELYPQPQD